jgi:hypothetical protein
MSKTRITSECWREYIREQVADTIAGGGSDPTSLLRQSGLAMRGLAMLLERGEMMESIPQLKGMRMRAQKACFHNSMRATFERPDLSYVEGYGLHPEFGAIHHAWCTTPEGVAIDLTWREPAICYFGVRFTKKEIAERVMTGGEFSMFDIL